MQRADRNRFNCERYLLSCKQFLNYVLEKEDTDEIGSIHDYAKCDDDMFLYYFAQALLDVMEEKETEAAKDYEIAERHLRQAEGTSSSVTGCSERAGSSSTSRWEGWSCVTMSVSC